MAGSVQNLSGASNMNEPLPSEVDRSDPQTADAAMKAQMDARDQAIANGAAADVLSPAQVQEWMRSNAPLPPNFGYIGVDWSQYPAHESLAELKDKDISAAHEALKSQYPEYKASKPEIIYSYNPKRNRVVLKTGKKLQLA